MRWTRWALPVAVLLLVAGCGGGQPPPGPTATPTPGATTGPPGSTTTAAGARPQAVPVYYVGETPAGWRLFREFHRLTTADPASDAVREVLRADSPIDPDYRTHWPASAALRVPVTTAPGLITVDLSGVGGGAQMGSELAERSVQQLVFTVQGALQSTDPVQLLVDGAPVAELFGVVGTAGPLARPDPYAARSLVQIDDPAHGARVSSPVVVSGEAAVFEATLPWEARRDGQVVASGFAMTAEGQRFAPFRFEIALEPGRYEIVIREDDPSGGAGRPPMSDTKTVTVS